MILQTPPRRRRGFTLIEAMIVIAIVGLLSALAMVAISNFTHVARVNTSTAVLMRALVDVRLRAMTQHCPHFVQINGFSYSPGGPVAGAPILRGSMSVVQKANCASPNPFFEVGDKVLSTTNLGDADAVNQGVRLYVSPVGAVAGAMTAAGVDLTITAMAVGYVATGARTYAADVGGGLFVPANPGPITLRFAQTPNDQYVSTILIPTTGVATRP